MTEGRDPLESQMNLRFPMITISVSYDDPEEPIHVDLGSIPPFVAVSVFERILEAMSNIAVGPKITFKGDVLAQPFTASDVTFQDLLDIFGKNDDDEDEEN
jgi:hypothetical protein